MFKAYKVLMGHRFVEMWENKLYFLYEILTPLAYGSVFFLQAIFIYSAKRSAFEDLSKEEYILGIVISQVVFMLGNYNGFVLLAEEIMNTQFDFVLLRPIKIFFYKYLRGWDPIAIFMTLFYIISSFIVGYLADINLIIGIKLFIFTICAALLRTNFFGFVTGWIFYLRSWNHVYRIDGIMSTAQNSPKEVFTSSFRFILTYILPSLVTLAFGFEIIRNRDSVTLWTIVLVWLIGSMCLNKFIWKQGIKNYESFS